jgi:hypothetical protein
MDRRSMLQATVVGAGAMALPFTTSSAAYAAPAQNAGSPEMASLTASFVRIISLGRPCSAAPTATMDRPPVRVDVSRNVSA